MKTESEKIEISKQAAAASIYRIWCRYEPDFINPLTARRGRWRVYYCSENNGKLFPSISPMMSTKGKALALDSTKPYPRGSIIRPHKELNRVLAARKTSQA